MSDELLNINENCKNVEERIRTAAIRAGRNPDEIKLIAVTKTVDADRICKALEYGITDVGENRVQELCDKYSLFGDRCKWHLIGHLQTNKVKYIIDKVSLIHSLDSMELAEEIQKRAEKAGRIVDVLVQVNVAKEATKFGIDAASTADFLRKLSKMGNIKVRGLMTIAPFSEDPEQVRWVFSDLRKLHIDIIEENIDNIDMDYLSMGMSNDFEVAIEEGANMVRVGTAIFGKRQ